MNRGMHAEKAFWIILLTILLINLFLIDIVCVNARFYFPVTSGLSSFYHYGTLRYGTLFGLSGVNPYAIGCGIWGFPYGWHIPGAMGFWGGFYAGTGPLGSYMWPYWRVWEQVAVRMDKKSKGMPPDALWSIWYSGRKGFKKFRISYAYLTYCSSKHVDLERLFGKGQYAHSLIYHLRATSSLVMPGLYSTSATRSLVMIYSNVNIFLGIPPDYFLH